MSTIPQDKTPIQRAQLKLISHFAIIGVTTAVLAALAYINGNSSGSIDWGVLGIAIASQVILALLDAAKKYFAAQNEPSYADLMELARNEVAARSPEIKYTANEQAIAATITDLVSAAGPKPATVGIPDAPASSSYHEEAAEGNMVNTLPIIIAVKDRAQG